jgi:putative oxidoreductase
MKNLFSTNPINLNLGLLVLRIGFALFLGWHGYEKLQNIIAGNSAGFPDPLHVGERASHGLAVFGEFFCSILIALGLCFRPALLVQIVLTLIIATQIHSGNTFTDGEHALLFFIGFLALLFTGSGQYALDKYFKK